MSKKHTKGTGDNMPLTIESIIMAQSQQRNDFIEKQNNRLSRLREIEQEKNDDFFIQQKQIIKKLQSAGILDEHGEISAPYRIENE